MGNIPRAGGVLRRNISRYYQEKTSSAIADLVPPGPSLTFNYTGPQKHDYDKVLSANVNAEFLNDAPHEGVKILTVK